MSQKLRLLLVEDETFIRDAYAQLFAIKGYDVETAENGQDGIDKAKRWQPDIIMMDARMPIMNGLEAIKALRSDPQTAGLLIYGLTAYTDEATINALEAAGANNVFSKPPDLTLIDETVRQDASNRQMTG